MYELSNVSMMRWEGFRTFDGGENEGVVVTTSNFKTRQTDKATPVRTPFPHSILCPPTAPTATFSRNTKHTAPSKSKDRHRTPSVVAETSERGVPTLCNNTMRSYASRSPRLQAVSPSPPQAMSCQKRFFMQLQCQAFLWLAAGARLENRMVGLARCLLRCLTVR